MLCCHRLFFGNQFRDVVNHAKSSSFPVVVWEGFAKARFALTFITFLGLDVLVQVCVCRNSLAFEADFYLSSSAF